MHSLQCRFNQLNLTNIRRNLYELVGNGKYSRPSLNDLDQKLAKYLDFRHGFFVELGANDGFTQSNTYYLEKIRHWRGVLVEPIPALYVQAVKRRPRSKVFNYACVPFNFPNNSVAMTFANLMSVVNGSLKDPVVEAEHIAVAEKIQNLQSFTLNVPARTLNSILDECRVSQIDFMSLDVEGYELNVLQGLDFERYRPSYILIEARFKNEIDAYILDKYRLVEQMSVHDFLYKSRVL